MRNFDCNLALSRGKSPPVGPAGPKRAQRAPQPSAGARSKGMEHPELTEITKQFYIGTKTELQYCNWSKKYGQKYTLQQFFWTHCMIYCVSD